MNFAQPEYIINLSLIPLSIFIFWAHEYRQSQIANQLADSANLRLKLYNYRKKTWRHMSYLFIIIAEICVILTLATPTPVYDDSADNDAGATIFALDVSKSMLALDGDKYVEISRLDIAKQAIQKLAAQMPGKYLGLLIFSGEAKMISPFTYDHKTFLNILHNANHAQLSKQGSNLQSVVSEAQTRCQSYSKSNCEIVLISDGGESEFFSSNISDNTTRLFTIGVGSIKGSPIPFGTDIMDRKRYEIYQGKTVITKLQSDILRKIAKENNGHYFELTGQQDIETLVSQFTFNNPELEKNPSDNTLNLISIILISLALLCLVIEYFLNWNIKFNFWPRKKSHIVLIIIGTLPLFSGCQMTDTLNAKWHNMQGQNAYLNTEYRQAISHFQEAHKTDDFKEISLNNLCSSYYQLAEYEKAWEYCKKAVESNPRNANSWYNLGNSTYRLGESYLQKDRYRATIDWQEAVKAYEKSLKINPDDQDTQGNYNFVLQKLQDLKNPPPPKMQPSQSTSPSSTTDSDQTEGNETGPLSEKERNTLREMLKDLPEEEQRWQNYFHNDPFFNPNSGNPYDTEEKDW